jgi:adenine-specific DNA-methyltransferase
MLIVCGFAFAPEVDDTRLNFGGLTVLKARMNQDLRMADKLKATGAGNLFVVFGEPDIAINELSGDMLQVEIRGMDIFDPTTGEVRSSGGKELLNDVAAWFVDHDYDEESFFVRQAYFVGDDPYDGLKRALKAEIDETAWAELNSTVSRSFPKPESGRICVKVINHFGDEVQKVFGVVCVPRLCCFILDSVSMFHNIGSAKRKCRRKAKMSALSKVGMSVFSLLVVRV